MKTVVTGGMGFIGSHLCEGLLREGHDVTIVDDLSTGALENISGIDTAKGLTYHIDTILNRDLMEKVIDGADVVFHLGAVVGVKRVLEAPLRCLETNVQGTEIVLEAAERAHVKVLLASSSEAYGKNGHTPLREDGARMLGATTVPRWVYSVSKIVDECFGINYWRERELPVVVMRFFNIVGPRQTGRYGMVLPNFVRQALAGQPITVYGDGEQVRSFTYVLDAVSAILSLAENPRAVGEIFNIGGDEAVTIGELAQRVKKLTGSESPIRHVPLEEVYGDDFEEPRIRVPDISKLKAYTGYRPRVGLDEMIARTVAYVGEKQAA